MSENVMFSTPPKKARKYLTSKAGNSRLRALCAQRGVTFYSEHNLGRLNDLIEMMEGTPAAPATAPSTPPPVAPKAAVPAPAPAPEADKPAAQTFPKLVAKIQIERKLSLAAAVREAVATNPDLHRAWVESGQCASLELATQDKQSFAERVAAEVAGGKSKSEAIHFCVQNFPGEYAEWRKGDTSKL